MNRLKGQSLEAWDKWLDEEMHVERFREFVTRRGPHGEVVYKCLIESVMYKHLLGALKEAVTELKRRNEPAQSIRTDWTEKVG